MQELCQNMTTIYSWLEFMANNEPDVEENVEKFAQASVIRIFIHSRLTIANYVRILQNGQVVLESKFKIIGQWIEIHLENHQKVNHNEILKFAIL